MSPNLPPKTQKELLESKSNNYQELEDKYFQLTNTHLLDPFALPPEVVSSKKLSATVIIPAGNVKNSIIPCLTSIEQSSFNQKYPERLQVIVVDDGSNDGTWDILKNSQFSLNVSALRQKHHGQAQALNTGIAVAKNDIIICCDADMVLSYYAIEQLMVRHELFSNVLLVGFRSNTPASDPRVNADFIRKNGVHRYSQFYGDERIVFPIPGNPSNMCLATNHFKDLGNLKGLLMRDEEPWLLPDLVFGALFSLPRQTYIDIGGYDERFVGWGCTDGYLASKAISVGKYIVPVYSASGLHISHPDRSTTKYAEYEKNRKLFIKLIETSSVDAYPNFLKNAKDRVIETITLKHTVTTANFDRDKHAQLEPKNLEIDSLSAVGR